MKKRFFLTALFLLIPLWGFAAEEAAEKAARQEESRLQRHTFKQVRREARGGDIHSLFDLAWHHYRGKGTPQNYKKAYKYFKKAAKKGSERALYFQASMLLSGRGVKKNEQKAFLLFKQLAHNASPHASFKLSLMYEQGLGTEKNEQEAARLLDYAARNGVAPAALKKGLALLETQPKQAKELIKQAADMHFRRAQYHLARLYEAEQNKGLAFQYMLLAAQKNLRTAQWQVAQWYAQAYGTPKSDYQTFRWTRQAAKNGVKEAQAYLAVLYENGIGTAPNKLFADKWKKLSQEKTSIPREEEFY